MQYSQAQLDLEKRRVYRDGGLKIELVNGELCVNYTGPVRFASKLGKYFDDVRRFGGSHLAMTVANQGQQYNELVI